MKAFFQKGFSLIEVLIATGILGAGALTFMQIQNNNIAANKKTETRYDVNALAQDIHAVLLDENACRNTFRGRNFLAAVGTGGNFTEIRDGSSGNGQVVYGTGPVVANVVNINRYQYEMTKAYETGPNGQHISEFRISFFYQEASGILRNSTTYEKKINQNFKVVMEPSGVIINCFSDTGSNITENVRSSCEAIGGTFSAELLVCNLNSANRNFPSSLITDIDGVSDSEGMSYADFRNQIIPNLLDQNFLQRTGGTLEDGIVMNGRLILAQSPVIDTDMVNLGYVNGLLQCPAGTSGVYVRSTNSINCRSLVCNDSRTNAQQYLAGIDSNGNPACNDLVDGTAELCSTGGTLRVQPNGSVKYECCTPTCDNEANICPSVQYASSNNCGICSGKKIVINNEWSSWGDTGEMRNAGACIAGVVQVEKRQTRTCSSGNECGLNNCTGNSERWVSSGTKACAPPAKACASTCDCTGGYEVCESGVCVDRENSCVEGVYSRGDDFCQWICLGSPNQWGCASGGKVCNKDPIFVTSGSTLGGLSTGGLTTGSTLGGFSTGGFSTGGLTTTGGSSGGSSGPCINNGGGTGGMLDSGSNGTTTNVYQEPCLNMNP